MLELARPTREGMRAVSNGNSVRPEDTSGPGNPAFLNNRGKGGGIAVFRLPRRLIDLPLGEFQHFKSIPLGPLSRGKAFQENNKGHRVLFFSAEYYTLRSVRGDSTHSVRISPSTTPDGIRKRQREAGDRADRRSSISSIL